MADAEQAAQEAFGYQDQAAEHADVSKAHVHIAESQSSAAEKVSEAHAAEKVTSHMLARLSLAWLSHKAALRRAVVCIDACHGNLVQRCREGKQ